MNIFVVDSDPIESARSLLDKHVVKMPLETAQMLSTNQRVLDGRMIHDQGKGRKYVFDDSREDMLYKATMINHPCTIWARQTLGNHRWLCIHGLELCMEYTRRYNRIHACQRIIQWCHENPPRNISQSDKVTPFAQAMPEKYRNSDAVIAYRNYYIHEKYRIARWKCSKIPSWFSEKFSCISKDFVINSP